MPLYYFNLRDGDDLVPDEVGMDLENLTQARAEAKLSARDILADQLRAGQALDGQLIEIANQQGEVLDVLKFSDALPRRHLSLARSFECLATSST